MWLSFSMKQRRQKVWKFILHAKEYHVNKNKGTFVFFSLLQKLTDAGNLWLWNLATHCTVTRNTWWWNVIYIVLVTLWRPSTTFWPPYIFPYYKVWATSLVIAMFALLGAGLDWMTWNGTFTTVVTLFQPFIPSCFQKLNLIFLLKKLP